MSLDFMLTALRQTRKNMEDILDSFSIEELNRIPPAFRNNLIWNYGHVIVTQQLLCYRLAELPMLVSNELVTAYRKGSAPDAATPVSAESYKELRELSQKCLDQFGQDIRHDLLEKANYEPYPTSYGVTLSTVEEAAYFNLAHEAMHLGTILALRKLI